MIPDSKGYLPPPPDPKFNEAWRQAEVIFTICRALEVLEEGAAKFAEMTPTIQRLNADLRDGIAEEFDLLRTEAHILRGRLRELHDLDDWPGR